MIGLITWLRWSIAISLHCKDSFPHFVINKQFMNQYSVTQKYFRIQWWFLSYFKCISGDCKTVIPRSPNFLIPTIFISWHSSTKRNTLSAPPTFFIITMTRGFFCSMYYNRFLPLFFLILKLSPLSPGMPPHVWLNNWYNY